MEYNNAAAVEDYCCNEVAAWVDIANRLSAEAERVVLVTSIEPQAREDIFLAAISERFSIVHALSIMAHKTVRHANEELLRVNAEVKKAHDDLTELPRKIEAKERSMMSELHAKYEVKVSEMNEGGAQLQDARSKLQAEIVDLTRRRDEELSAIAEFRKEAEDRRNRLQEYKVAAADDMKQLEEHLEVLRNKVATEKALLESLGEEEAVKRKKIDVLASMGMTTTATVAKSPDSAATTVPSAAATNKIDYGISTLQAVRDQLRGIREASQSPLRRSGSSSATMLNSATPSASVTRSLYNTSAGSLDSVSVSTANNSASPVVNPWKERLRQLQGDLQLLRADLGAK